MYINILQYYVEEILEAIFLADDIKHKVYSEFPPENVVELRQRIINAFISVP